MKNEKLKFDPYDKKVYTLEEYIISCFGGLPNESELERQWDELPDVTIGYDSTAATVEHKLRVSELIGEFCSKMLERAAKHDNSKLSDVEKSKYDGETLKLKHLTYDSPEYKESLERLGDALTHHYENNSHHPEHYDRGIEGMNLLDIIEMLLDWKAATERHNNGDIHVSIEKNQERFGMSDQLVEIFKNTASDFGWFIEEQEKKKDGRD